MSAEYEKNEVAMEKEIATVRRGSCTPFCDW
jgi:hypothetical protein